MWKDFLPVDAPVKARPRLDGGSKAEGNADHKGRMMSLMKEFGKRISKRGGERGSSEK